MDYYKSKYLKYKLKYFNLKQKIIEYQQQLQQQQQQEEEQQQQQEEDKYHDIIVLDFEFKEEFKDYFIERSQSYNKIGSVSKNDSLEELITELPNNINEVLNYNLIKFRVNNDVELKDLSISGLYTLVKNGNLNIINLSPEDIVDGQIKENLRRSISIFIKIYFK